MRPRQALLGLLSAWLLDDGGRGSEVGLAFGKRARHVRAAVPQRGHAGTKRGAEAMNPQVDLDTFIAVVVLAFFAGCTVVTHVRKR